MKITAQALLDNGWGSEESGDLEKKIRETVFLWYADRTGVIYLEARAESYETGEYVWDSHALPNITSMEELAQLEYLLSEPRVFDTAPIDAAIRARFAEGEAR